MYLIILNTYYIYYVKILYTIDFLANIRFLNIINILIIFIINASCKKKYRGFF
jgi:hypothetical protein